MEVIRDKRVMGLEEQFYEEEVQCGKDIILEKQRDIGQMQTLKEFILRSAMPSEDDREEIIDLIRAIQFEDAELAKAGRRYAQRAKMDLADLRKRLGKTE